MIDIIDGYLTSIGDLIFGKPPTMDETLREIRVNLRQTNSVLNKSISRIEGRMEMIKEDIQEKANEQNITKVYYSSFITNNIIDRITTLV
jgi:hypothetical protein